MHCFSIFNFCRRNAITAVRNFRLTARDTLVRYNNLAGIRPPLVMCWRIAETPQAFGILHRPVTSRHLTISLSERQHVACGTLAHHNKQGHDLF